jgi:addiction module HigA family antidote
MTGADLARALSIPRNRVSEIINGKRAVTVDTALRLAR